MVKPEKFDVCLVNLDPTVGAEIKKTRPCLVISPNSMNHSRLKTVIIAPLTSKIRENFPTRVTINFADKRGQVALDQLRVIDRARVVQILGPINRKAKDEVTDVLQALFAY